jgi:hypothetical protein
VGIDTEIRRTAGRKDMKQAAKKKLLQQEEQFHF